MDIVEQPQGLISVLLDKTARDDERHDAAMDLVCYPTAESAQALLQVATDPSEDFIVDVTGESLGHIWVELNTFDPREFEKLVPLAKREAFQVIQSRKPVWVEEYRLSESPCEIV